jgi:hypothetical protein
VDALDVELERLPAAGQVNASMMRSSLAMTSSHASQVSPLPGPPHTRGILFFGSAVRELVADEELQAVFVHGETPGTRKASQRQIHRGLDARCATHEAGVQAPLE